LCDLDAEEPDEQSRGRKLDLIPAPCDATVWVEGRRYIDFDPLLPIECKRLPTPNDTERDEREYVFNQYASTGGIQRFKSGHHGAAHKLGAMIAYVQRENRVFWHSQVAERIMELVKLGQPGWSANDLLQLEQEDETLKLVSLRSSHAREKDLPEIELRHLWVQMN